MTARHLGSSGTLTEYGYGGFLFVQSRPGQALELSCEPPQLEYATVTARL